MEWNAHCIRCLKAIVRYMADHTGAMVDFDVAVLTTYFLALTCNKSIMNWYYSFFLLSLSGPIHQRINVALMIVLFRFEKTDQNLNPTTTIQSISIAV
jgi:hypothetical protein